jgi:hypothetical protein
MIHKGEYSGSPTVGEIEFLKEVILRMLIVILLMVIGQLGRCPIQLEARDRNIHFHQRL